MGRSIELRPAMWGSWERCNLIGNVTTRVILFGMVLPFASGDYDSQMVRRLENFVTHQEKAREWAP